MQNDPKGFSTLLPYNAGAKLFLSLVFVFAAFHYAPYAGFLWRYYREKAKEAERSAESRTWTQAKLLSVFVLGFLICTVAFVSLFYYLPSHETLRGKKICAQGNSFCYYPASSRNPGDSVWFFIGFFGCMLDLPLFCAIKFCRKPAPGNFDESYDRVFLALTKYILPRFGLYILFGASVYLATSFEVWMDLESDTILPWGRNREDVEKYGAKLHKMGIRATIVGWAIILVSYAAAFLYQYGLPDPSLLRQSCCCNLHCNLKRKKDVPSTIVTETTSASLEIPEV